ncbi:hypothetical protein G3I76_05210 [Streptomyces sp. SID11233]|nr:hypothetical protein [Streptomyces sp. SID11233]
MPAQNNYDSAQIRVDPGVVQSSGNSILTAKQWIDLVLNSILAQMDALRLSWVGDDPTSSPRLAAEFTERWSAAVTLLYGDGSEANPGVLGTLADGGIVAAARNYSKAESAITGVFQNLYDNLHTPAKSTADSLPPPPPPTDHVDHPDPPYHETSVEETF